MFLLLLLIVVVADVSLVASFGHDFLQSKQWSCSRVSMSMQQAEKRPLMQVLASMACSFCLASPLQAWGDVAQTPPVVETVVVESAKADDAMGLFPLKTSSSSVLLKSTLRNENTKPYANSNYLKTFFTTAQKNLAAADSDDSFKVQKLEYEDLRKTIFSWPENKNFLFGLLGIAFVTTFQQSKKDLRTMLDVKDETIVTLNGVKETISARVEEEERKTAALESKLRSESTEAARLVSDMDALSRQLNEKTEALSTLNTTVNRLLSSVSSDRDRDLAAIKSLQKEVTDWKSLAESKPAELPKKMGNTEGEASLLKAIKALVVRQRLLPDGIANMMLFSTAPKMLDEIKAGQVAGPSEEDVRAMEASISALKQQSEALVQDKKEQMAAIASLEKDKKEQVVVIAELRKTSEKVNTLEAEIRKTSERASTLEAEVQKNSDRANTLEAAVSELNAALKAAKAESARLSELEAALKSAKDTAKAENAQVVELTAALKAAKAENDQASVLSTALKSAKDTANAENAQVLELTAALKVAKAENAQLTKDVQKAAAAKDTSVKVVKSATPVVSDDLIQDMQSKIDAAKAMVKDLNGKLMAKDGEQDARESKLTATLKASEQANEQLLKEIAEAKAHLSGMKRQLDQSNLEVEQAMLAAETAATVSEEAAVKKVKAPKAKKEDVVAEISFADSNSVVAVSKEDALVFVKSLKPYQIRGMGKPALVTTLLSLGLSAQQKKGNLEDLKKADLIALLVGSV